MHLSRYERKLASSISQTKLLHGKILFISYRYSVNQAYVTFMLLHDWEEFDLHIPYILESNPHPFYSFRGLKNQMRIRFAVESWILEK
jgi:hypothetical protein